MMPTPEPIIPYHPPQPPLDPHLRTSDELLAAAEAILARPDAEIDEQILDQACQNIWGAVARRLSVFADARRWYFCENGVAGQLVNRIDDALGVDPHQLLGGFATAEHLFYGGFYEYPLEPDDVRFRMPIIRALCAALDDAHRTLPLDLAPPNSQRYRDAARRCAERRARRAQEQQGEQ